MASRSAARPALLAALAFAIPVPSALASSIEPAMPVAFEPVNLRMTVDGCAFAPATVRVAAESNTIRITQQPNACLLPGPAQVVDVRLGSLPPGEYRVEVHATPSAEGTPAERLSFTVTPPVEPAVFPPAPRPLTDYSGMWWTPSESGWGLSLHQSALHTVFGTLHVYDASRRPQWFAITEGRWSSSTQWTGTLYRTRGPALTDPVFDPALVEHIPAGTATFDFSQVPGTEGRARLTYAIDGVEATKLVTRMRY